MRLFFRAWDSSPIGRSQRRHLSFVLEQLGHLAEDRAVLSRHLLRDQAQSCGVLHALDTIMAQIASISERLHSRASVVLAPNEAHVDFRSE
jgi:hypothetical protein